MNKYAIIEFNGVQEKVSIGDVIRCQGLLDENEVVIDKVLVVFDEKLVLGKPYIEKAKVSCRVVSRGLGRKIRVSKFKAKSKYHNTQGFRPQFTKLKIIDIAN